MSISFLDGHMDTLHLPAVGRRRPYHSPAFKAEIVAACLQPGVSTTAIALVNQLNPNLVRLWIPQHQRAATEQEIVPAPALVPVSVTDSIEQSGAPTETYAACLSQQASLLPPSTSLLTSSSPLPAEPIRLEWRRGDVLLNLAWPTAQAESCIRLLRELLP